MRLGHLFDLIWEYLKAKLFNLDMRACVLRFTREACHPMYALFCAIFLELFVATTQALQKHPIVRMMNPKL